MTEWRCTSGNCASGTAFSLFMVNGKNPPSAAPTLDPYIVKLISPAGFESYQCNNSPTQLDALPVLEIAPLVGLTINQDNTLYTQSTTTYTFSFTTTSEIELNGHIYITFPARRAYVSGAVAASITYGGSTTTPTPTPTLDAGDSHISALKIVTCTSAACPIGAFTIVLTGIKNPDFVEVPAIGTEFTVDTRETNNAVINRGKADAPAITPKLFATAAAVARTEDILTRSVQL